MPKSHITCLVDNSALLSSPFWAEHGLSFLIQVGQAKVLFDTGQSGDVLAHNLAALGEGLEGLSAIVLSHGHYDHTGGLKEALRRAPGTLVVAHPHALRPKFSLKGGQAKPRGLPFSRQEIESWGQLRLTREAMEVAPGVFTTGEVPRPFGAGVRAAKHVIREGGKFVPDPFTDDQALVVKGDEGLIVVLGCCHAGLLNTLEHVRQTFGGEIYALLGGTHLEVVGDEELKRVIAAVRDDYGVQRLYLNHCTGLKALTLFLKELGERVKPCPAGSKLEF